MGNSYKRYTSPLTFDYAKLTCTLAIDYIRSTQMQERTLHGELSRLRNDAEYARESHRENELLRTEAGIMHERLRRLDPSTPHVYGQYTSQLTQQIQQQQSNGQQTSISLPPINSSVSSAQYGSMPHSAPMQGVEYGASARSGY